MFTRISRILFASALKVSGRHRVQSSRCRHATIWLLALPIIVFGLQAAADEAFTEALTHFDRQGQIAERCANALRAEPDLLVIQVRGCDGMFEFYDAAVHTDRHLESIRHGSRALKDAEHDDMKAVLDRYGTSIRYINSRFDQDRDQG